MRTNLKILARTLDTPGVLSSTGPPLYVYLSVVCKHFQSTPSSSHTVENHPYLQQPLLKKYCDSKGIVLEAYSPLGNPTRPVVVDADPVVMDDPTIKELATKHNASPAQVCSTLYCIHSKNLSPLVQQKFHLLRQLELDWRRPSKVMIT